MKTLSQINKLYLDLINQIKIKLDHYLFEDLVKIKIKIANSSEFEHYRDLAYTTIEHHPEIYISSKLKLFPWHNIKAILMHEIAHFILIKYKKEHTEIGTDKFAERLFDVKIYYDENNIQSLRQGTRPRPKDI